MERANILVKDNTVGINIPISKSNIDVERRIVSGWATIDNVDQMLDKVTAEASLRAFNKFRGNVREMHDKKTAVGKVVHFNQKEFMTNGKAYTGIYVDVYVSKGAESTWQKVLDGTLSAFSVYGPILEISKQYDVDKETIVKVVTDYELIELSLVDNPGNELCNVVSISKNKEGIAENVDLMNVFWCEDDKLAEAYSDFDEKKCMTCTKQMEIIGTYESVDDGKEEFETELVKILKDQGKITKNLGELNEELDETKGGSQMSEVEKEKVEAVAEVEETEEAKVETEETSEKEVEVVKEPDLVSIGKALESIQESITKASAETREETLTKIQEAVASVEASVATQLEDLRKSYSKLEEEVKVVKDGLGAVEKSLSTVSESLEKSSAVQKSSNVEPELIKKGPENTKSWSGSFLPRSYDQ